MIASPVVAGMATGERRKGEAAGTSAGSAGFILYLCTITSGRGNILQILRSLPKHVIAKEQTRNALAKAQDGSRLRSYF